MFAQMDSWALTIHLALGGGMAVSLMGCLLS
jgi:hypothetical protein